MTKIELEELLRLQKKSFQKAPPDYEKRKGALKRLSSLLDEHQELLIDAVSKDFGLRAREETIMLEIFPVQAQIKHAISNLRKWMKRRQVGATWYLLPASAFYQFQPLGSVGIMGAWNYQIMLTLGPLVDALAAGNHAIIKPSEISPNSAEAIRQIINANFEKEYIYCVTGGADLAKDFSSLAFDHLFFTGSTSVGKLIMEAAAQNLTPVTLELGGKSPAIVHESYPMRRAVKRILSGKLFNAGQTCVATDYVILPEHRNTIFEEESRLMVEKFYPHLENNDQYTYIINEKHYQRLKELLRDAEEKGARVVELADVSGTNSKNIIAPTILFNVTEEMRIMQEEIFGPLLPVVNLDTPEEAVAYVNNKPKPLALYYFDENSKRRDQLLKNTLSGGVTFNDTVYHLAQHNLPFGGVGDSGMGHYHGFDGFKTFSKKRAVMHQKSFASSDLLHPPYTNFKRGLIQFLGKITKL